MNDKAYWLWLQQALGYSVNVDEIVGYFENAKNIYEATRSERMRAGVFTKRQLEKLEETPLSVIDDIILSCKEARCRVLTPDDPRYPKSLIMLQNYPLVLYYLGNPEVLTDKMAIALVGTRKASQTGLEIAGRLASSLARSNVIVVSGGALGIDGASHIGALSENGVTVAVLGCGFLAKYRDSVANLKGEIAKNGLVVSEYPPRTPAIPRNFPLRNRIISALSHGVVVVEGALGSGSLITANYALQQGKELFAVPGDAIDSRHSGTAKLIRDGATAVFSCADVLSVFEFTHTHLLDIEKIERTPLYENKKKFDFSNVTYKISSVHSEEKIPDEVMDEVINIKIESEEKEKEINNLTGNAKIVYDALTNEAMHIDDILRNIPSPGLGKIMSALTQLEMKNLVSSDSGKKYRRK